MWFRLMRYIVHLLTICALVFAFNQRDNRIVGFQRFLYMFVMEGFPHTKSFHLSRLAPRPLRVASLQRFERKVYPFIHFAALG
jgi:hypothetical protein